MVAGPSSCSKGMAHLPTSALPTSEPNPPLPPKWRFCPSVLLSRDFLATHLQFATLVGDARSGNRPKFHRAKSHHCATHYDRRAHLLPSPPAIRCSIRAQNRKGICVEGGSKFKPPLPRE
ncbi:uncharacterized protein VTP21DRAFT_8195 [Calcarisporiella thermophila]|uniref:uncharacterized protein n=1 Tax=Calcarisporiella thermophila TaxID=911321 RepID=UPI0037431F92